MSTNSAYTKINIQIPVHGGFHSFCEESAELCLDARTRETDETLQSGILLSNRAIMKIRYIVNGQRVKVTMRKAISNSNNNAPAWITVYALNKDTGTYFVCWRMSKEVDRH